MLRRVETLAVDGAVDKKLAPGNDLDVVDHTDGKEQRRQRLAIPGIW